MRIFLDTMASNFLRKEDFDHLINEGHILIVPNTAVDIVAFQKDPFWLEDHLKAGHIVVQIWSSLNQMVSKPFFWSSCNQETSAASTIEEAVMHLPNAGGIIAVAVLVEEYGLPRGEWPMGDWSPPAPLCAEAAKTLGLDAATATRTDVLAAAKEQLHMELFDEYHIGYNRGLAKQHCCTAVINRLGGYCTI